jgi:hypothetical protein
MLAVSIYDVKAYKRPRSRACARHAAEYCTTTTHTHASCLACVRFVGAFCKVSGAQRGGKRHPSRMLRKESRTCAARRTGRAR